MRTLEVLTPSYGPDLELCRDLHRSVARFAGPGVGHRVVVPAGDRDAFADLDDERTRVDSADAYLPRWLVPAPRNLRVDLARPWWPVRGWIAQQIVKLEATARSTADVVVVADSDLAFVRPFDADTFAGPGGPLFYALPDGVHAGMARHVEWHRVARRLLGLAGHAEPPLTDYVCWPCPWDPRLVRDMLDRIGAVNRRPWQRLVASQRHFSEMILYGVYVDEVLGGSGAGERVADMRCLRHTEEDTLDDRALAAFVAGRRPDDVAVMISAKSGTSLASRRRALGTG